VDDLPSQKYFLRTTRGRHNRRQARYSSEPNCNIHSAIPMLRTAAAACLHRLSTGLCTASLDAHQRWRQTVGAVRYNGYEWPARAAAGMPTAMGEVAPVSVAEIAPRGEEFERTPPHDLAAEQCVLGGMLMSKDAISDVLEVIHPGDHYRPAHQLVHEVILDLYSRGEPADAVTVANELTKRGEISRVGGAPYLHTLIASVPTAANAGYYARIVRERAILRRLVEAGTRIVQLGYSGDGDADEIVDRAEAEVYSVTARRVSEDYLALAEIMPGALDEIEAIGSRGGGLTGVPTGFADLDALTNGLHPGQMIVIAARPALGKALALNTTLPTPTGWTTMGQVAVGDQLVGADGRPVLVVAATEVMHGRPCYEVTFSTGEVIVADGQHQWLTWAQTAGDRHPGSEGDGLGPRSGSGAGTVLTTEQIAAAVDRRSGDGRRSHAVPACASFDLPEADLPVLPYTLGVWLGGPFTAAAGLAIADPEIGMRAAPADFAAIPALLPGGEEKRIPMTYLRGSEAQRRALLAGILDIGGTVAGNGAIHLAVTSRDLACDVRELVLSLGYRCSMPNRKAPRGDASAPRYLLRFLTDDQVFLLSRKRRLHKERLRHDPQMARWRYIVGVRRVSSRPVRCVQVDSPDHLYLAGDGMIPTHNSTLALDLARAASVKAGQTAVIFSLEMSRNEITMRLLSAEARVPLHSMRTGQMSEDDWTRLARRMSEVVDAPLFIDDSPNMSMMEIRAKCRRLKQRHDLRLVIIDYLQLMSSPKRVENRQQEVSDMSRQLKLLAKELDVPVVAVAQLNRGPEQRTDKRPLLADLRESGSIEQDADVVLLLHREDAYERESPRAGEADLIVAKHRNGPTATVTVAFQGHYSRFSDMARI
jgi:replicative DNA helicase